MKSLLQSALIPYGSAFAMEPNAASHLQSLLRGVDMAAHIRAYREEMRAVSFPDTESGPGYEMHGSVAMLSLSGPLTKTVSSMSEMVGGTGMIAFAASLAQAAADPAAKSIVMVVDSPGGSVDGTEELYQCIQDAAAVKPVYAYAPDLCASAAFYAACGASALYAGPLAAIGSIGCYTVLTDSSKAAEMEGYSVVVVGDGEMKGTGVDGTPITDAQKADVLRVIKDRNAHFVTAVSKGRGIPIATARSLADGRIHIGAKAQALGLTDGTCRMSDLIAKIQGDPAAMLPARTSHPNARMGNRNAQNKAAQLRAEENPMSKSLMAAALAALGLHNMAGKAMAAPDDDPQALATLLAADMGNEVQAQLDANPLLMSLKESGVLNLDQLQAMSAAATKWQGVAAAKRTEAKANAALAYAAKPGELAAALEDIEATADGPAFDRLCARLDKDAPAKEGAKAQTKPVEMGTVATFATDDRQAPAQPQPVAADIYTSRKKAAPTK
jgi:signal peptide peptidase SppA